MTQAHRSTPGTRGNGAGPIDGAELSRGLVETGAELALARLDGRAGAEGLRDADRLPLAAAALRDAARDLDRRARNANIDGAELEPGVRSTRPLVVEPAGAFLARSQDVPQWLIRDLVAVDGITMLHGRPRSMKSLSALHLAVAASLGVPVFGSPRFVAERPLRTVYMTEEDSRGLVAARLHWLLAGLAAEAPEMLWLSARKGLSLETPDSQGQILDVSEQLQPDLLLFDTGRAFAPSVDKGPSDAAGPIRFLRSILADTCIKGVVLVHHDTKPGRDGQDARARSERASGGALLAAADCPIGFERLSDREALAVPDRFKPSADPAPFRITFESATPAGESFRDWLRVSAAESNERAEAEDRTAKVALAVLEDAAEWLSANAIATRAGGRKQDVLAALRKLADEGRAMTRQGARGAKEYRSA